MRLFATQQEPGARPLVRALLRCPSRSRGPAFRLLLTSAWRTRSARRRHAGAGGRRVATAIETREEIFQPGDAGAPREAARRAGDPALHGLASDTAQRIGLGRLESFEIERMPGAEDVYCFWGRSREVPQDERLFVLAEVRGDDGSTARAVEEFERVFLRATSALRALRSARDPRRRLHWNRIFIAVEPVIRLDQPAIRAIARTLAPASYHQGLEKVVVRLRLASNGGGVAGRAGRGDPTGDRMEVGVQAPETRRSRRRRVRTERRRDAAPPRVPVRLSACCPRGADVVHGVRPDPAPARRRVPVPRDPGGTTWDRPASSARRRRRCRRACGACWCCRTRRTAWDCPRRRSATVVAIDLAEREGLPVEWVPISAGARIAMDSGTENLDATARVVRRIITFTERGGVIHLIVYGVNVGAQSYWNALATMVGRGRGVLVMTPDASWC
jgi:hypothetical protein